MTTANLVPKTQLNILNKRVLSVGEPCTCEYVTLHQSFHRVTLNTHWYIAQNFYPTFSMFIFSFELYTNVCLMYLCEITGAKYIFTST